MAFKMYALSHRAQVVDNGQQIIVTNRRTGSGHRLTGASAEAVRIVRSGGSQEGVAREVLDALVANGVLVVRDQALVPHVTRRQALAAAAAVGISTLALPRAAAAASPDGEVGPEGEGGGSYGPYTEVRFFWSEESATADEDNWNIYQEYYDEGTEPVVQTGITDNRVAIKVPDDHRYMQVSAVGGKGFGSDYDVYTDLGLVSAQFMVQPGDWIQAIVGSSSAAGEGSYLNGSSGGRGVGLYWQGATATTGQWLVVAGGSGGSTDDRSAEGGAASNVESKADGKPQQVGDIFGPFAESAFRVAGKGGKGAIATLGAGGAGGEASGDQLEPGAPGSAGSSGSATLGSSPMALSAGGAGGVGGVYVPNEYPEITQEYAGSTGGSGGGSGYRGGGGGGGSGSGYNARRIGGGGGAGSSYVNEGISATGWSYVEASTSYGVDSSDGDPGMRFQITFFRDGFGDY